MCALLSAFVQHRDEDDGITGDSTGWLERPMVSPASLVVQACRFGSSSSRRPPPPPAQVQSRCPATIHHSHSHTHTHTHTHTRCIHHAVVLEQAAAPGASATDCIRRITCIRCVSRHVHLPRTLRSPMLRCVAGGFGDRPSGCHFLNTYIFQCYCFWLQVILYADFKWEVSGLPACLPAVDGIDGMARGFRPRFVR